nr:HopJ type III effector protein [Photobacterium phosphoreum]
MNTVLEHIKQTPNKIDFNDIITAICHYYHYQPTRFTNGNVDNMIINQAGTNEGSCKIFAFAQLYQLSKDETLACFGAFYRHDVLEHPQENNHQNIRQFMLSGWNGITFDRSPLTLKTTI